MLQKESHKDKLKIETFELILILNSSHPLRGQRGERKHLSCMVIRKKKRREKKKYWVGLLAPVSRLCLLLRSKETVHCSHTYGCVLNFSPLLSVRKCHVGNQFMGCQGLWRLEKWRAVQVTLLLASETLQKCFRYWKKKKPLHDFMSSSENKGNYF